MAHETLENVECPSVIYLVEYPSHPTQNITIHGGASLQQSVSSTSSYSTPIQSELSTPQEEEIPTGRENDFFPALDVIFTQDAHDAEPVSSLTDKSSTPCRAIPGESCYELDSRDADRVAPHLLDHMYSISCKPSQCRCGECDANSDDETEVLSEEQGQLLKRPHSLRHHEYDRGQKTDFKCCYCDYTASRRQHVKQHLATHLVDKPFKCKMCDYSASQKQSLVAHALRFHYKRKPFKCDQCDYSAFRKQHVVVHMGKHMKEKPFKCDDCDFQTSWKEYLSVHKKNLHPASKSFKPWCE